MTTDPLPRKLAAILYADVAGYSRLTGQDEDATHRRVSEYLDLIADGVESRRGRVMHYAGDAVLAVFEAAVDALACATQTQALLGERNAGVPDEHKVQFRMGVNLGDVIEDRGDVYGDGVNVAARLESLADPGGVCVSSTVHELVRGKLDLAFEDMGEQTLKNIAAPVRAYRVRTEASSDPVSAPPAADQSEKPTIAVLPFDNMSGDAGEDYFADGITEDLITALSKNRWLLVSSRNSTFIYKGQATDVRRVAADLGAGFVLEGSVRRAGRRVRITAQLIDADTGNHIWAERYDRDMEDIFELQDEITGTIAARIEPEVGAAERERVRRKPPQSLDAWDRYLLGLSHLYRYTAADNAEAQRLFREVIGIDPAFGPAHAGLAYTMFHEVVYFGAGPDAGLLDAALGEARQAVALDDKDALSRFILGRIHLVRREYDQSIAELETAIDLNPCLATARCGLGDSLAYSGHLEESLPHFADAVRMSPHDPRRWAMLVYGSLALMLLERYEEAADWARRAVRVPNATFWADAQLVAVLSRAGRVDEARAAAAGLLAKEPTFTSRRFVERFLFYYRDQSPVDPYVDALVQAGLPA